MIDFQVTLAILLILFTLRTTSEPLASATDLPRNTPVIYTAIVNVTYKDPLTGEQKYEYNDGWFSSENRIGPSWGWLQLVRSADNRTDGCDPILNRVEGWWVALVERGRCRFHQKIENAAVFNNASAVIIYNNEHDAQVLNMQHSVEDVVAIFLRRNDGLRLVKLMENNTRVFVTITPGSTYFPSMDAPSRTSIIFLFISFIVLAVVSLLWLIFYYVQRFRLHSSFSAERARKNKIMKQLNQAAKLVVSKMEQKILKPEDPELSSAELQICAVCVEEYKINDKIRILPCRHSFHKKCVDQWLHEKRRCPICQLDILKTAGIQIPEEYQNLNHDPPQAQAVNDNNNNDDAGSSNDMSPVDADSDRDTVLVSIVPGCSTHLYLTSVSFVNENAQTVAAAAAGDCAAGRRSDREDASETTYHSNDSLLVLEALERDQRSVEEEKVKVQEFKPRLSSDTLSLPSAMSSSSSSTFDIEGERNLTEQQHQNNNNNNNNRSNKDDVVVVVNGNHNNNTSMTSVNSRLTAVACRARDDDDDDDDGGGDDDSHSSSFSPSRYYDCHVEAHKQQTN